MGLVEFNTRNGGTVNFQAKDDDSRIQTLKRNRDTGKLAPPTKAMKLSDEIQSEPWNTEDVRGTRYNIVKDRFESTSRRPTDEERFNRMKIARDTIDIPTPKNDLDRIREIEGFRRKRREDTTSRGFIPKKPTMPELPVNIPRP